MKYKVTYAKDNTVLIDNKPIDLEWCYKMYGIKTLPCNISHYDEFLIIIIESSIFIYIKKAFLVSDLTNILSGFLASTRGRATIKPWEDLKKDFPSLKLAKAMKHKRFIYGC